MKPLVEDKNVKTEHASIPNMAQRPPEFGSVQLFPLSHETDERILREDYTYREYDNNLDRLINSLLEFFRLPPLPQHQPINLDRLYCMDVVKAMLDGGPMFPVPDTTVDLLEFTMQCCLRCLAAHGTDDHACQQVHWIMQLIYRTVRLGYVADVGTDATLFEWHDEGMISGRAVQQIKARNAVLVRRLEDKLAEREQTIVRYRKKLARERRVDPDC